MRGGATSECVPERIVEQLSRDGCSEMCSGTHSNAVPPHFRHTRAPCKHQKMVSAWSARLAKMPGGA
eukprot:8912505-Lingulodinium_polyedra.AAC.1